MFNIFNDQPSTVRDRLLHADQKSKNMANGFGSSEVIADLFPHTTVLFADISGFT